MARGTHLSIALFLLTLIAVPALGSEIDELQAVFSTPGDADARVKAGMDLAKRDPDALATAVDALMKAANPGDADILVMVAVQTKVRHIRLLLAWAASTFKDEATAAFLDKIDNDYPDRSIRAVECLGFIGDHVAYERIVGLLRNQNELIAIQAARALARIGQPKDASALATTTLEVDNGHVRLHLTWAVQDILKSKKKALGAFGKFMGKRGTIGFRAKEAVAMLEDELCPVEKYNVKFAEVRKFFTPRGGVKVPPIRAPEEQKAKLLEGFEGLKRNSPGWYHFVCTAIDSIEVSGSLELFDFNKHTVKVRFADLIKWDRSELVEYYLIRFAGIMFLGRMGDPKEGHRGWEEGMMDGWIYAMDHTKIAVIEDPVEFMKERIKARPW
jgi:HEAT repeat protein